MFRKLKRVWSHNDMNYIPNFRKTFPELNKVSNEEMRNRWISLGIDFYTEEKVTVGKWVRLTIPFAIALMFLMIIGLPFNFIFTGKWSYSTGKKSLILNWFRSLRLV